MNIATMLDLPKAERSRYLAAMPLTRCYVFGALDQCFIKHVRRVITRHGGTWSELYAMPGLAVTATFRSHAGMMAATRELVHWLNRYERAAHRAMDMCYEPCLYTEDFGTIATVPALRFEITNAIDRHRPVRITKPTHPIRG